MVFSQSSSQHAADAESGWFGFGFGWGVKPGGGWGGGQGPGRTQFGDSGASVVDREHQVADPFY